MSIYILVSYIHHLVAVKPFLTAVTVWIGGLGTRPPVGWCWRSAVACSSLIILFQIGFLLLFFHNTNGNHNSLSVEFWWEKIEANLR